MHLQGTRGNRVVAVAVLAKAGDDTEGAGESRQEYLTGAPSRFFRGQKDNLLDLPFGSKIVAYLHTKVKL